MFFKKFKLKSKNLGIIAIANFLGGFLFFLPVLAIYLQSKIGSVAGVAIIFSVMAVVTAVLEVPTGAFADLFGRKLSYSLGLVSLLLGIIALYFGETFWALVIFAVLAATSQALMSGADDAIIYDTLKEEKKELHYKEIAGIFSAIWPLGAIIGALAGGFFAKFSLSLPIILTIIPIVGALILSLFIKEPKYRKEEHKNIFRQMAASSKIIFTNRQVLLLLSISLVMLAFGESAHNLKAIFFEFKQIPVEYFGIILAAVYGLSSLAHYLSFRISSRIGNKSTILISAILFPAFLFLATITGKYISVLFILLTSIPFGLRNPVLKHLINEDIESSKRATILSINSLSGNLGVALVGPLLGYFADIWTINTAYFIAAVGLLISVVLAFFIKERALNESR